jgi:alpha-beta hydrolase superfamily lysophospholipase
MSYGYDSASVFSKSVTDIDAAASMLLGRLRGSRKTDEQKKAPIVFVAHSLGGLVVKKVITSNILHPWAA